MKTYDEISNRVLERRNEYLYKQREKRKKLIQLSTAVGCFVLVAGIGFGINADELVGGQRVEPTEQGAVVHTSPTIPNTSYSADTTKENLTTTVPATNPITQTLTTTVPPELYHEIDWNYKSTPGKFCAVILDSAKYGDVTIKSNKYSDFNEYVYPFGPYEERATTRKATEFISDMQIVGHEPDGTAHETAVDIFALEGLNENLAIGVRFPDDDRIYTYVNSCYIPETLGEFLQAIDYDNTVTYGGITLYPGNNFSVNDENFKDIKSYLLSHSEVESIQNMAVTGYCVTASIYCHELGRENKYFKICEDGYISTNLIGYEYVFYVGKEAVANFLKDSYNITFEQIKEITAVTMQTTEPYTANTTTSSPARPPKVDTNATTNGYTIVATAPDSNDPVWWCGTETE